MRKDLSLERLQVSGALILAWCSALRKVSENPFIKDIFDRWYCVRLKTLDILNGLQQLGVILKIKCTNSLNNLIALSLFEFQKIHYKLI